MEKYIAKFYNNAGQSFYTELFMRDHNTFKTMRHRRRDGLKGEEFICHQGGEFINVFENHFHQLVEDGVTPEVIYSAAIYKMSEDYHIGLPAKIKEGAGQADEEWERMKHRYINQGADNE